MMVVSTQGRHTVDTDIEQLFAVAITGSLLLIDAVIRRNRWYGLIMTPLTEDVCARSIAVYRYKYLSTLESGLPY